MYRTVPPSLICAALVIVGAGQVAPGWYREVGFDFWNEGAERAKLREAIQERAALIAREDSVRHRSAITDRIFTAYCSGRTTPTEAIEGILAVAAVSPGWFDELRSCFSGRVSATASDTELATYVLRLRVKSLRQLAESEGNPEQEAALAGLLARFDDDVRQHESPADISELDG
jgi:hypothetical protein